MFYQKFPAGDPLVFVVAASVRNGLLSIRFPMSSSLELRVSHRIDCEVFRWAFFAFTSFVTWIIYCFCSFFSFRICFVLDVSL